MQWTPYSYSDKVVKRSDPNKKRRWLIPLILAAQIAFKVRCSRCSHHILCLSPACSQAYRHLHLVWCTNPGKSYQKAAWTEAMQGESTCAEMVLDVPGGAAEAASRALPACIASAAQVLAAPWRRRVAVLLQVLVLDRVLEEDGVTGDAYGPYEAEAVLKERERVAREKVLPPSHHTGLSNCCALWYIKGTLQHGCLPLNAMSSCA